MSGQGSITHWIGQLKAGDHEAAQHLWERYFQQLVHLARKRLKGTSRRAADEEDVALSAFHSFCRRAEQGRFPQLFDRDDLWRLLVVITERKALDQARREGRQKRGGGKVRGDSALLNPNSSRADQTGFDRLVGNGPTPEFAALMADECRRLLDRLGDETLRSIALWKMEGYTTIEMAEKLSCTRYAVGRKLRLIRSIWQQEMAS